MLKINRHEQIQEITKCEELCGNLEHSSSFNVLFWKTFLKDS